MKIIITENQVEKILSRYLNKLIKSPEFEWVDKIDIEKTTKRGRTPICVYTVYKKPEYSVKDSDEDRMIEEILNIHSTLFYHTESGIPDAYYSVDFVPE